MHERVIIDLEDARHIYSLRTGHAGPAGRTGNPAQLAISLPHPANDYLFGHAETVDFRIFRNFEVLGISMDDNGWEDVKPFLAQMKVNYRVVIGDDATAQAYGGVDSLPTTLLIDKQGKIAAIHLGLDGGRKDFEDGVDALLREGDTPVNAGNGAVPPAVAAAKQQ